MIKGETKKRSIRKSLGSMNYHVVTGIIKESNDTRNEKIWSHQYSSQSGSDRYLIKEIKLRRCLPSKRNQDHLEEPNSWRQKREDHKWESGHFKQVQSCNNESNVFSPQHRRLR